MGLVRNKTKLSTPNTYVEIYRLEYKFGIIIQHVMIVVRQNFICKLIVC